MYTEAAEKGQGASSVAKYAAGVVVTDCAKNYGWESCTNADFALRCQSVFFLYHHAAIGKNVAKRYYLTPQSEFVPIYGFGLQRKCDEFDDTRSLSKFLRAGDERAAPSGSSSGSGGKTTTLVDAPDGSGFDTGSGGKMTTLGGAPGGSNSEGSAKTQSETPKNGTVNDANLSQGCVAVEHLRGAKLYHSSNLL